MNYSASLLPGTRVGNYVLESRIGTGAFAEVWKAHHHERSERIVAVKIATNSGFRKQLQREVRLPEFAHPNVVSILDSDTRFSEIPYIVMPCFSGGNLAALIQMHPTGLSEKRTAGILSDILCGLAEAHSRGVIHRDIKPSNILIDESGRALIADFGLSVGGAIDGLISMRQSISVSGTDVSAVAGSYAYMAPEVLEGTPATTASDVYSVGIVLFEMLTGRRPHGLELPSLVRPSLSKSEFWDALFYWSSCRHEERYQNSIALREAADGTPKPFPLRGPTRPSSLLAIVRPIPRSLIPVTAIFAACILLAFFGGSLATAITTVLALILSTSTHLVGPVFVALAGGLPIKEVQIAFGQPILYFRIGILHLRLGYLPWGGSVRLDNDALEHCPRALLFLLHISGPLAVLCLAGVCIGHERALAEFISGFGQIVYGAISPLTTGKQLVSEFFTLVKNAPFPTVLGVVASKIVSTNLLPLPMFSGGEALLSLFFSYRFSKRRVLLSLPALLVGLAIFACWAVALGAYVWDATWFR